MFIDDCMLIGFEVVWLFVSLNEKWRKLRVLVKNDLSDDFDVNWWFDFMFVMFLIAFKSM